MIIGKPINDPALLVTMFEGYGDLIYHTPTIRALSKRYTNLDVWCKREEPFLNNPYIRKLTVFKEELPETVRGYQQRNIMIVDVDSRIFIPHYSIHTVDLISLKAILRILRDSEKSLKAYWRADDLEVVQRKLLRHPLAEKNKIKEGQFAVISPSITWESRTLPLSFYQELISGIQAKGFGVVLVGKEITYNTGNDINKTLYPAEYFPEAISLYNELTFLQLCALYSITPVAINSENGNNPISCTNDFCWNIYIPTLTPPEFRLAHRHGSQRYRTAIAANTSDYYPTAVYGSIHPVSSLNAPIELPPVGAVLSLFDRVLEKIRENKNFL